MNDLIRAFLVRAVTSAGLDDDTIDQIMQQLRYIFDGQTAKGFYDALDKRVNAVRRSICRLKSIFFFRCRNPCLFQ